MIKVDYDVPPVPERRGRPFSEERVMLLLKPVGASFFCTKRRETLYQLARSIGIRVKIDPEIKQGVAGWRITKTGFRPVAKPSVPSPELIAKRKRKAKRLKHAKSKRHQTGAFADAQIHG